MMARSDDPGAHVVWPVFQSYWVAQALALQFQLERTQWWSAERLRAQQFQQAEQLIRHAAATVPFYRDKLGQFVAELEGGLTIEKFRELPLLTKVEVQSAGDALQSSAVPKAHGRQHKLRTSGSTGRPVQITTTELARMMIWANTLRGHTWHERDITAKNVEIRPMSGDEPTGASRWVPLPNSGPSVWFSMSRPIPDLFDCLVQENPTYLQTHPNVVLGLVERSREIGVKPEKLREIRCYGEVLNPEVRQAAMSEWGVAVHENYSSSETGTIAVQCPESENLHVVSESVLVEVLDETGQPCEPGEWGQVVVTGLLNFAMPFIRYAIADYAVVGGPCACGRGLPVLERVIGRERNFLMLPSGEKRMIAGGVTRIVNYAPILQLQYVQTALDHIKVNLVVERALTDDEERAVKAELVDMIGPEFQYSLAYWDEIPRAPSGKFEIVRCEVAPTPDC